MSFRIIQFENLPIIIKKYDNNISLSFKNALIKKTMEDAEEKTLWEQDGSIEIINISQYHEDIVNDTIKSISISYDFYTYKNILMLPFSKKGDLLIEIEFINNNSKVNIACSEIDILMLGNPKYIKHIKKTE